MEKAKPGRNWRVLLTELGIIVLGVSIALGAEQAVQWLNWRGQVAEAREVIATEMTGNVRMATLRLRSIGCIERRLDALSAVLDAAAKNDALPAVGDIGIPPRGFWSGGAWDSVVASQTATHFPRQQLADLSRAYRTVGGLADFGAHEITAWNSLYAMVGPGRRLDPASEAKLRDALGQARAMNRLMGGSSGAVIRWARESGLPFSAENLAVISNAETVSLSDPKLTAIIGAICPPIGAVPSNYGQAMYSPNRGGGPGPRFTEGEQQSRQ